MTLLCARCGRPFIPTRPNNTKCSPRCGRNRGTGRNANHARAEHRATALPRFIGVDGEGVTTPRGHDYVLLSCGDAHFHNDGARLGFVEIMGFLYAQFQLNPDAVFVGFYLGYDFAQWLRDLPAERASRLLSKEGIASRVRTVVPHLPPFPVEWEGWEFDTLALRRFRLRPAGARYGKNKHEWLTVCDVGPFFQCSFLRAIDPKSWQQPIVTEAEYDMIALGKSGRGCDEFGPAMIAYNQLECEVLARLMLDQARGLRDEGIKLRRDQWIGPGQAAQKWLRKIEAPTGEMVRANTAPAFREAARGAYYGGWFEVYWHGPHPGIAYSYDVNSAYPAIMSRLPCLLHGKYLDGFHSGALVLVEAAVKGSHPIVGAMLQRLKDRSINRPRETEGWFWWHELEAAKRAGFIDRVRIKQALSYEPCDCPAPIAPIAELYKGRLAIGKNSSAGKARKLIYNSCYGKCAQSVGAAPYANAIYASLITAGCRTMIIDAIASHPNGARDLLMTATDSVTFASPHTTLQLDDALLGAWSASEHSNLSLFMPGVYWDDATRDRLKRGDVPSLKSRGIAARDLARRVELIDRAWGRMAEGDGWPKLELPIAFQLVSPKQALARNKWELCGAVVTDAVRTISADPAQKRVGLGPGRSRPYQRNAVLRSTPYDGAFGEELREYDGLEFGDHPDAPIGSVIMRELWR